MSNFLPPVITPFSANYEVSIATGGTHGHRLIRFPETAWSQSALHIRVRPHAGIEWEGIFSQEFGAPSTTLVSTFPDPNVLCVVADGVPYLISATEPQRYQEIGPVPVLEVLTASDPAALVLVSFCDISVYATAGRLWSKRVSWDGFRQCRISHDRLLGECWYAPTQSWYPFEAELRTGEVAGGCPTLPPLLPGEPP